MREIKFRAFDKPNKIMRFADIYDFDELSEWEVWERQSSLATNDSSKFDVMQFTGLQDKNGVDIYENDVIKRDLNCFFDKGTVNEVVRFSDGQFNCSDSCLVNAVEHFNAVVIGNIYENPELLELNDE